VNPIAVAHGPTAVPDGVLVQEAAAGGGGSYAALYDRYSEQVYNYCLRLTGSPHDAADATHDAFVGVLGRLQDDDRPVLDFASYLFAAARNESYALMKKRSRAQPTDELPDRAASQPDLETDPERAVLLHDAQEAVRRANSQLPPRHREVLALREVAGRSYDEIGEVMGISENAAAQLIFRARGKLKEALTAGAVASVVAATDDCEHAQLLITRLQDGEPITDDEHLWLDEHLRECGSCRAARGMLLEVGATYSAWAAVPVIAALRPEVLTRAGEVIGVDWSGVAASTPAGDAGTGASGNGAGDAGGTGGTAATGGLPKPRGHHFAAQGALGAAVLAVTGIVAAGILHDGSPVTREAAPAELVRPAAEPDAATAASAAKAKSSAPAKQAAGGAPAPGIRTAPEPEKQVSRAPSDRDHGTSPDGSPAPKPKNGPKPGAPKPGQPKSVEPGQPAPDGPGNQPGGGPTDPPGSPGGGQADPPGQPTDPGANPPPPENPPPSTGVDCSWPGHGNGPGGCPPGHGGVPPGQGGTPPGLSPNRTK
jgi:RNA polymerase sigma factor (sigma-70 family)